jgi:hypothetical protein
MSKHTQRDLAQRAADLEQAMKAIGRVLADPVVTPKQRIAQATGILRMYDCTPHSVTEEKGTNV